MTAPGPLSPRKLACLAGLLGLLPYAFRLLTLWQQNLDLASLEQLMPGIFVLPLAVVLLFRPTARRPAGQGTGGAAGLAAVVVSLLAGGAAGLLALAGWPLLAAPLLPIGLAAAWAGLRDVEEVRRRAIPLAMLALVPPLPRELLGLVQPPLALLGAWIAAAVGTLAGLAPQRTGVVVQGPHYYIRVVDACSGLYLCLMFLIVSLTLAQLCSWSRGRAALALALAVPLGLLFNGLRLSFLLLLGNHWPELEHSDQVHDASGLVLFVVGLLLLAAIGGRRARPSAHDDSPPAGPGPC